MEDNQSHDFQEILDIISSCTHLDYIFYRNQYSPLWSQSSNPSLGDSNSAVLCGNTSRSSLPKLELKGNGVHILKRENIPKIK